MIKYSYFSLFIIIIIIVIIIVCYCVIKERNDETIVFLLHYIYATLHVQEGVLYGNDENGKLSLLLRHDDILCEIMKGDYCVRYD